MPEIMLHLARPAWLLLLPLPAVLSWLLYRQGTSHSGWARLLPETVAQVLLSNTTAQHRGRWWLLAGGWRLIGVAQDGQHGICRLQVGDAGAFCGSGTACCAPTEATC